MSTACLGCTLRGGPETPANNSHGVCTTCASGPIHIPCDRVRLCSEAIGTWSKASPMDAFQQWDTGKGAVVPARKFYLSATRDGNVALVFGSDVDAFASWREGSRMRTANVTFGSLSRAWRYAASVPPVVGTGRRCCGCSGL